MINITIVITSEICKDGKYNQSLLLEKLKKPVTQCTYNLAYIVVKASNEKYNSLHGGIFFSHK